MNVFKTALTWPRVPSHETARLWLQKTGLFKLLRPKDRGAQWVYITDISIQMGLQKCLVVVGCQLNKLSNGCLLTLEDLEPLALKTLKHCPGEVVRDTLAEVITKTGEPVAIITDGGSEFKKGMRLLESSHPAIVHIQDTTHKLNTFLKQEMDMESLDGFREGASQLVQKLKLTPIAHLAPPRQRAKNRLLSIFPLIKWAARMIRFLESPKSLTLIPCYREKLEWIMEYRSMLAHWKKLIDITKLIKHMILKWGFHRELPTKVREHLARDGLLQQGVSNFITTVMTFLEDQSQKVPEGLAYPGCSDIIESLFGKFKQLEGPHSSAGFSSLVLTIPALVGSLSESIVKEITSTISTKKVKDWISCNLGSTYASERRDFAKNNFNIKEVLDIDIHEKKALLMA